MSMTIDEAFAERHAILLVPARSLAETREAHAQAKRLVCSFCVPGQPLPKQRARVVNGHGFTPRKTRDNEAAIRDLARAAMNGQPSYAGPVKLEARFYRADARKPLQASFGFDSDGPGTRRSREAQGSGGARVRARQ
jgi:hypothetical protein